MKKINLRPKQIRFASDLHLEQYRNVPIEELEEMFLPIRPEDDESILILAGDISSYPEQLGEVLCGAASRFMHVLCVPGNHEYYGHIRAEQECEILTKIQDIENVTYSGLSTAALEFENVTLVGNTLWSDGGRTDKERVAVNWGMNDFRYIHDEDVVKPHNQTKRKKKLTLSVMQDDNAQFRDDFIQLINTSDPNKLLVCVSHHLPFYELCHPRFGDELNGGFACDFIELKNLERRPDYWIFGHTHDTVTRDVHGITMLSNPSGYRNEFSYNLIAKNFNNFGVATITIP